MASQDLKGFWKVCPSLPLSRVASEGRPLPATGTFEKYVWVCPGKGVMQAKRYPGKGHWLGRMNVSQGKGIHRCVRFPAHAHPSPQSCL